MKTLQEIKEEVAKENGWQDWDNAETLVDDSGLCGVVRDQLTDEVANRYAKAVAEDVRRRCAENATMEVERSGKVIADKQIGWLSEDGDHIKINKDSILNTEIILP